MLVTWLAQFKQHKQIRLLDIHLACFLTQKAAFNDDLMAKRFSFLILLLNVEVRTGHVCIDLNQLNQTGIDEKSWLSLSAPSYADWKTAIDYAKQKQIVSDGNIALSPLVFWRDKLYFHRMWMNENSIAHYFNRYYLNSHDFNTNTELAPTTQSIIKPTLDHLFNQIDLVNKADPDIDWQKVAVAVALTRKIAMISGGPGTGKTTTVAKILAGIKLIQPDARIVAAAPTGKAASRLTESLNFTITQLGFESLNIKAEAVTLHRLLGAKSGNQSFIYNKKNRLHIDLLVIDEASMVDLNMMAKVIDALPSFARLILLGDKDQLSSVEAGAVFGDLCEFIDAGYSELRARELSQLTGYNITAKNSEQTIADSICLLQKSYRFNASSGIGLLASAVKEGKINDAKKLLVDANFNDIHHYPFSASADYSSMLLSSAKHYQHYLMTIKEQGTQHIHKVLNQFAEHRLLCAVREGPFGVDGLNKQVESLLAKQALIHLKNYDAWYIGRPIMILKNSVSLGLYNGDIGITLASEKDENKLRVYFPFSDGTIKSFSPSRLPEHETVYVMTVHKSQGSEFDHVNIVLPTDYSPLLNRSLLYTAITRAKKSVAIYASSEILNQTIKTQTVRQSGLVDLLRQQT